MNVSAANSPLAGGGMSPVLFAVKHGFVVSPFLLPPPPIHENALPNTRFSPPNFTLLTVLNCPSKLRRG